MKSIRITDEAYRFLKEISVSEHRSMIKTLDFFISVFKEYEEGLATESVSPDCVGSEKTKNSKVVSAEENNNPKRRKHLPNV